jgi:uncharacterized protein
MSFVKQELANLFRFLKTNKNEAIVLSSAALFISLNSYHQIWNQWFSSFLYFAILPIAVILIFLRKNPLHYGFQWGEVKIWGRYIGIFCLIAAPILFFSAFKPDLQKYYRIEDFNLISYFFINFISLFSSEFLFRGFLIFGLKDKLKEFSILIQMIPFVLVHLGKPELETISTIITGIIFGFIVYRGNSFWPAFIIHMFINVFFVALVNLFILSQ